MVRRDSFPDQLKLVVFDLDYTLWDAGGTWCDQLSPPFSVIEGKVVDQHRRHVRLYSDVLEILDALESAGITVSLASRTCEPDWARELLELLEVEHRFEHPQIYPGGKVQHLCELRTHSGLSFDECLFFDDEHRNIVDCSPLGVKCLQVHGGVDWSHFRDGLKLFH